MHKKIKKVCTIALSLAIAITYFNGITSTVQAAEVNSQNTVNEYEIYPNPQRVSYYDGSFNLDDEVNVVFDKTIDDVTKNKLNEVLSSKDVTISTSDKIVNGKTNVLVGTNNSGEYVDQYVKSNVNITTENLFDNIDSYILNSKDDVISILGKDTDAAFYGVTTLKHIFNQSSDEILNLSIEDYANTDLRGFIEGYYGIPWSNEDRASLMKFGGEFKMNTYIFAPKDDPYHNQRWRDLYPEEELAKIKELVQVGNETKTKFTWSIHPFMNDKISEPEVTSEEAYQNDMAIIKAKFDQLYSVGVRQFGVCADDIQGRFNPAFHSRVMEDLLAWGNDKEEHIELIFVPTVYTGMYMGWGAKYVREIGKLMPKEVHIMWTGESVLGRVTQETVDNFMNYTATPEEGIEGRKPFFWLNWPVNDINNKRLIMSPATVIDKGVKNLDGIVTNPMQQAEASKISLFSVADFAWNVNTFDHNKAFEDSFKYIEPNATEYLHELAKHLADPDDASQVLPESEEFVGLFEEYNRLVSEGKTTKDIASVLIPKYERIIDSVDKFKELSQNENLKKEIEPWINSLRDVASASIEFLNLANQMEDADYTNLWDKYKSAKTLQQNSKTHIVQNLGGPTIVEAGAKRLVPFMNSIIDRITPEVYEILQGMENSGETIFDRNKQELTYLVNNTVSFEGIVGNIAEDDVRFKDIKEAYNNYITYVNEASNYLVEDADKDKIDELVSNIKAKQKEIVSAIIGDATISVSNNELVNEYLSKLEKLDKEGYTVRSLNEVKYAVNDLVTFDIIINDNNLLKEELTSKIENKISKLVEKSNNERLQAKLDEVAKLGSDKYTEESWKAVQEAVDRANALIANDYNATKENEEDVLNEIDSAILALVEKVIVPGEDNNNGGNNNGNSGNNGENNNGDNNNSGNDNVNKPGNEENNKPGTGKGDLPNTGGTTPIIPLAIGGLILLAGVVTLRKKAVNN